MSSLVDLPNSSLRAHGVSCKFTEDSRQAHSIRAPSSSNTPFRPELVCPGSCQRYTSKTRGQKSYLLCVDGWQIFIPVKNLSSQLTHWELTWESQKAHPAWVTVSSFWGHLCSSQWTHKMSLLWDCCELSVSLQLSQLANCYLAWWVIRWSHKYLTASSRCEFEVF